MYLPVRIVTAVILAEPLTVLPLAIPMGLPVVLGVYQFSLPSLAAPSDSISTNGVRVGSSTPFWLDPIEVIIC